MATFLFVHGAFVGGWSWKKVTALLRAAGHEVYMPTLTGLGERVHLLNPDIDLETHIQDILEVISYEDLAGVILVGHSYSGLVFCTATEGFPFAPSAQRARAEAGWRYCELATAHYAMITVPQELTQLLLELV